jgi:hypothetical protein
MAKERKLITPQEHQARVNYASMTDAQKLDLAHRHINMIKTANRAYTEQLGNLAQKVSLIPYLQCTILRFTVKKSHLGSYTLPAGPFLLRLLIAGVHPEKSIRIEEVTLADKQRVLEPNEAASILNHLEKQVIWV